MSGKYKKIRKEWIRYMEQQVTKNIAPYDSTKHRILDSGSVVKITRKSAENVEKEVIEEVGMDYGTFRMKYNTSENPTW